MTARPGFADVAAVSALSIVNYAPGSRHDVSAEPFDERWATQTATFPIPQRESFVPPRAWTRTMRRNRSSSTVAGRHLLLGLVLACCPLATLRECLRAVYGLLKRLQGERRFVPIFVIDGYCEPVDIVTRTCRAIANYIS